MTLKVPRTGGNKARTRPRTNGNDGRTGATDNRNNGRREQGTHGNKGLTGSRDERETRTKETTDGRRGRKDGYDGRTRDVSRRKPRTIGRTKMTDGDGWTRTNDYDKRT